MAFLIFKTVIALFRARSLSAKSSPTASKGQASVEYLLLIALGIAVVVIGVAVALQLQGFTDSLSARVDLEREQAIAMMATDAP